MLDVIKECWLKWVMGIAGTGILAGFKYLSAKQKEVKLRQDAMEKVQKTKLQKTIQSVTNTTITTPVATTPIV